MKSLKKRVLAILMASISLFLCLISPVSAAGNSFPNYKKEQCANKVKQDYQQKQLNNQTLAFDEYAQENFEATINYDKIISYINSTNDELRQHFSSATINDVGVLIVELCCPTNHCENIITQKLKCENIIFEDGINSYYDVHQQLDNINKELAALQKKITNGENVSETEILLMQASPTTTINTEKNCVEVIFYLSENFEETLGKNTESKVLQSTYSSPSNSNTNYSNTESNDFENLDIINIFNNLIVNNDEIIYSISTEKAETLTEITEPWRPGRYIYVADCGSLSTGYRAKFNYNDKTYKGFVTAAHGIKEGCSVYTSSDMSKAIKIGTILKRKYSETVDAAFIKMTNSDYTHSNAIYYTSSQSGVTRQGTVLDGTYASVTKGSNVYKSGARTFLTSGKVNYTEFGMTFNGVYFYDLFSVKGVIAKSGDSGAVSYIVGTGAVKGKAVGIVKGITETRTVFIKASAIARDFGPTPY